ncbi:MAG: hypothetical protein IJ155_05395 [Prevotella sp.]|nr:hypothetical protein [Prevotella sp.]
MQVTPINQLLWWIQYGLTYEYDEKLWGEDRIFFAEESLYYPFCDCEDRAILFSRLVRDLLKLDVVLLYYANGVEPDTGAAVGGHLAAAVRFSEEDGVSGDYFTVKDKSFYVCDPTFYGGRIGDTMYYYVNTNPSIISLD